MSTSRAHARASSTAPRKASRRPKATALSLMLVDDHPLWRDMVRKILELKHVGTVVAEAADGAEALEAAARVAPDVIVMDIDLPGMSGIEATQRIVADRPGAKVLVLSGSDARLQVVQAIQAGASGYLLKTAGSSQIADAVRRIHAGELVFPPELAGVVLEEFRKLAARGDGQGAASPPTMSPRDARVTGRASATPPTGAQEADVANAFVREGEFWTLVYGGEVVRMKDSKGLRDIAALLARAGTEIHALDLVAAEAGAPARARSASTGALREQGLSVSPEGADAVLDPKAKAAYRARLLELQAEVEEAEAWSDPERASRAREEMDFIARELSSAVGIGGRDRKASSSAERARVNVTRQIRSSIDRIATAHPALGRHLHRSIRTGTFCLYDPGEPVRWVL